ncbi:hypothetical protein K449DRAFT_436800 [Hypoxylon sp. EC38]|nr:hypothetical protein K449DRAFT_436800 [Hypoxylon sp. EC38]
MASQILLRELSLDNVFTATDLEKLTRAVITVLPEWLRVSMNDTNPGERPVVTVAGVSNLVYHLSFFALQRLGWRTLLMSPRLADQGFAHLLRQTQCKIVLVSGVSAEATRRVKNSEGLELDIIPMVDLQRLEEITQELLDLHLPTLKLTHPSESPQLIIHSSGTTGMPKPAPVTDGDVGEIVRQTMKLTLPIKDSKLTGDSDFFSLGMDSLQASHARSRLLGRVDLGGHSLAANVAFDFPIVNRLTQHIVDVRNGRQSLHGLKTMKFFAESLVQKYTRFPKTEPGAVKIPPGQIVAEQETAAKVRIIKAISAARLEGLNESQMAKIVPLTTALGQHRLGLDNELCPEFTKEIV